MPRQAQLFQGDTTVQGGKKPGPWGAVGPAEEGTDGRKVLSVRQEPRNKMLGAEEEAGSLYSSGHESLQTGWGGCTEPGWQQVPK